MMLTSRSAALAAALLAAGLSSGCTTVSRVMSDGITSVVTPYKLEIVQGNVITAEQLAKIKVGSSRNDVRDTLGSPLLADPFHAQRWDYVFTLKRQGTAPQQRSVVILFEGESVKSVEAPELPSEREFVASISRTRTSSSGEERKLALTDAERAALPAPKPVASTAAADKAALAPLRTYPPLEAL